MIALKGHDWSRLKNEKRSGARWRKTPTQRRCLGFLLIPVYGVQRCDTKVPMISLVCPSLEENSTSELSRCSLLLLTCRCSMQQTGSNGSHLSISSDQVNSRTTATARSIIVMSHLITYTQNQINCDGAFVMSTIKDL